MGKKHNKDLRIFISKEEIYQLRKKMTPEELEGHYKYTRKSGHVHKDKSKYDRIRDKKEHEKEWN